jgi:carbon monoxide dehydrogenase subunit G
MRWLIRIIAALVVIGVALAAIGLVFLPRNVAVSRSIVIDAPVDTVWPLVSDLKVLNEWQPWAEYDPEGTKYTYSGPDVGVGQTMTWSSEHPNVGSGRQEVIAMQPGESITSTLDFGEMGKAHATMVLNPDGEKTRVTWEFRTDLGMNPLTRWFGLMFDSWVGNDYEKGLQNLKALAEKKAASGG